MAGKAKTRRESGAPREGMKRREAWCSCPAGHRFVASLFSVVDLDAQPEAVELLSDAGLQPARCTKCDAEVWLAEAFVLLMPGRKRAALFVPDALAHRELELRSEALLSLAASPSLETPPYAVVPDVVVGVPALHKWLFGEADAAPAREIHAAFKDLENPERPSSRPSLPPAEPQMDGVDVNEPLLDEDWLADDAIAPAKHRGGGAQGKRGHGEQAAPRGARPTPHGGVDFAGLLADDEGEPPAGKHRGRKT
jgi:hypothetical protein